jgi:phage gp46-like protein
MSDIASLIVQDNDTGAMRIDWLMDGPDLIGDNGLATAVTISLFTDRLADADDIIPGTAPTNAAGPADRRGWWGDMPADPSDLQGASALIGSRLWLRTGWPPNDETARRIELDVREALQWLIDCGVAEQVEVTTGWLMPDLLGLNLSIAQRSANSAPQMYEYEYAWSPTIAAAGDTVPVAPVPFGILTESGGQFVNETGTGALFEE